jgi:hypothetical protein
LFVAWNLSQDLRKIPDQRTIWPVSNPELCVLTALFIKPYSEEATMSLKGYGFAANANCSITTAGPESTPATIAGNLPFDSELSEEDRKKILEKDPLAFYQRPERVSSVVVFGSVRWTVEELPQLRGIIEEVGMRATTFRPEPGFSADDAVHAMENRHGVILVIETEDRHAWGHRHRKTLETAAAERNIPFQILSLEQVTPQMAAEAAIKLAKR